MISTRHALALMSFIGFMNVYLMRVNLSVALVAMVKPLPDDKTGSVECPQHSTNSSHHISPGGQVFDWNRDLQGTILGSFFYGYIVTQIPGGWLGGRFGGKKVFGLGVLCTAVFTLLTPVVAKWSVNMFIVLRIVEGLGEAVTFPAMAVIWSHWAPPLERSKLQVFSYAGSQFGTVIGLPLAGVITDAIGWQYVFYIFGGIACLWFIFWILLVHDTPNEHPRISEAERNFINSSLENSKQSYVSLRDLPWKDILISKPLWATAVAHFAHNWGFYTLLTCLPTFMRDVLQFDISQDSGLSCLPYVFTTITNIAGAIVVDTLRSRRILTTTAARKWANSLGLLGPAVCLVGVGYVGCDYVLGIVLLCLAGTMDGLSMSGYNVNHLDLAPKYAGVLMGFTNTIATIPGFLGPQVVGWLTDKESTAAEWRSVFYISAEIYVFGTIIYCLYGSGELQNWAKDKDEQECEEK